MTLQNLRLALAIGVGASTLSGCAVWDWMRANQPAPLPVAGALREGSSIVVVPPLKLPAPALPPEAMVVRRNTAGNLELVAKTQATAPAPAPAPAAVVAPAQSVPQPVAKSAAPATPVMPAVPDDAMLVRQTIEDWRKAWEKGQFDAYAASYIDGYAGEAGSAQSWQAQRRKRLANSQIALKFKDLQLNMQANAATAEFTQVYESKQYHDEGRKTLQLRRLNGKWLIESERFGRNS